MNGKNAPGMPYSANVFYHHCARFCKRGYFTTALPHHSEKLVKASLLWYTSVVLIEEENITETCQSRKRGVNCLGRSSRTHSSESGLPLLWASILSPLCAGFGANQPRVGPTCSGCLKLFPNSNLSLLKNSTVSPLSPTKRHRARSRSLSITTSSVSMPPFQITSVSGQSARPFCRKQ